MPTGRAQVNEVCFRKLIVGQNKILNTFDADW